MIQTIINKDIYTQSSGVYMIKFSDGRFYIGCSIQLRTRMTKHLRAIKSNFTNSDTCVTLKKMKDFNGTIEIILIESVKSLMCDRIGGYGTDPIIVEREDYHININKDNPLMLNRIKNKKIKQPTHLQEL